MCRVLLSKGEEEKKEEDHDNTLPTATTVTATSESAAAGDYILKNPDPEKQVKLEIVLSKIKEYCLGLSTNSNGKEKKAHPGEVVKEFQTIRSALVEEVDCSKKNGRKPKKQLIGKVLSGGYTNYSYKISLDDADDPSSSCCLFAKACFPNALWSPSHYYDLERQTTEFQLMEHFGKVLCTGSGCGHAPIATPYVILDVYKNDSSKTIQEAESQALNMRIIVCQWSSWADDQWANQFIEGQVDHRLIAPIAETMATINLTPDTTFDRGLNQGMKDGLNGMMAEFDKQVMDLFANDETKTDACLVELHRLGQDQVLSLMAAMREADKQKDVLSHADTHVFNWLVEKKPLPSDPTCDPQDLSVFGPNGSFCLVDFEMSHWTARGRDIGLLYSFPISAAYFHAAQGHKDQAMDIINCLRVHWEVYSDILRNKGNKSEQYLAETFRSCLGFCGMFLFLVHYCTGNQVELLQRDGLSEEELRRVMGLIGRTGIQFMEVAFCDDTEEAKMDLEELRSLFNDTVDADIAMLSCSRRCRLGQGRRPSRRRSSGLRTMDRRLSDASLFSLPTISTSSLSLSEFFTDL